MTRILCYDDSYLQEFCATVIMETSNGVVLDQTAFYPGGGGQPCDIGRLFDDGTDYTIAKVSREDGNYVHRIDGLKPKIGTAVRGQIDWKRRYQLMRTHTALHVLCGIVWREYGAKVTGGDM